MERAEIARRGRVLFLYNVPNWAIHHVGQDWAARIAARHDVTLMRFGEHERESPSAWDHVVWGYSTLGYSGRMLRRSLSSRPLAWLRWRRASGAPFAAVVQDPSELFPEVSDWKHAPPRTSHLRRFDRLAVTSNEMQEAMHRLGYATVKINTRSRLPIRERDEIVREPLRAFTRAQEYPRKNLPLFHALKRNAPPMVERFDAILGRTVLPAEAYARQIDDHNMYVCTSWQEGGPLPLMDALRRGCVVLTTRVGQTDELIQHGVNGFFCDTEQAFGTRIRELAEDRDRLMEMRFRALELSAATDAADTVVNQLTEFLP